MYTVCLTPRMWAQRTWHRCCWGWIIWVGKTALKALWQLTSTLVWLSSLWILHQQYINYQVTTRVTTFGTLSTTLHWGIQINKVIQPYMSWRVASSRLSCKLLNFTRLSSMAWTYQTMSWWTCFGKIEKESTCTSCTTTWSCCCECRSYSGFNVSKWPPCDLKFDRIRFLRSIWPWRRNIDKNKYGMQSRRLLQSRLLPDLWIRSARWVTTQGIRVPTPNNGHASELTTLRSLGKCSWSLGALHGVQPTSPVCAEEGKHQRLYTKVENPVMIQKMLQRLQPMMGGYRHNQTICAAMVKLIEAEEVLQTHIESATAAAQEFVSAFPSTKPSSKKATSSTPASSPANQWSVVDDQHAQDGGYMDPNVNNANEAEMSWRMPPLPRMSRLLSVSSFLRMSTPLSSSRCQRMPRFLSMTWTSARPMNWIIAWRRRWRFWLQLCSRLLQLWWLPLHLMIEMDFGKSHVLLTLGSPRRRRCKAWIRGASTCRLGMIYIDAKPGTIFVLYDDNIDLDVYGGLCPALFGVNGQASTMLVLNDKNFLNLIVDENGDFFGLLMNFLLRPWKKTLMCWSTTSGLIHVLDGSRNLFLQYKLFLKTWARLVGLPYRWMSLWHGGFTAELFAEEVVGENKRWTFSQPISLQSLPRWTLSWTHWGSWNSEVKLLSLGKADRFPSTTTAHELPGDCWRWGHWPLCGPCWWWSWRNCCWRRTSCTKPSWWTSQCCRTWTLESQIDALPQGGWSLFKPQP